MGDLRPRSAAPRGQHFLRPRVAADLVRNSGVTRGDLVVEFGAGNGVLTNELASRARRVIAIEIDGRLVSGLRSRFVRSGHVRVVQADALDVSLPREPFRVVANLPFAHATPILRRLLDDPAGPLLRADVVVQWGAAVKRCSQRPSTLQTISWTPWFEFTLTRRLAASCFLPPPSVDAAVMTITRRPDPLLKPDERPAFVAFLRSRFGRPGGGTFDVWDWTRRFADGTRPTRQARRRATTRHRRSR
ncbi:MAG: rRNA adenine N(6)-methyltransferase family protein [Actinomycetota bacterium]